MNYWLAKTNVPCNVKDNTVSNFAETGCCSIVDSVIVDILSLDLGIKLLPHVLPHELVKISTGEFGKAVVDVHLQQLRHSWDEKFIAGIEREHRELVTAYRNEPALKSTIEAYTRVEIKSFETAWEVVDGRFDILWDFCEGIATMFANTVSVESDFSILGWEMD